VIYYLKLFLLFGVPIAGGLLSRKFWQAALIGAAFGAWIVFDLDGVGAFDLSGGLKGAAYSMVATAVCGAVLSCIVYGVSGFIRNRIPERGRFYLQCWAALLALLMIWFVVERLAWGVDEAPAFAESAEADALSQQVVQLYQQGKYSEATEIANRVLAIREKALGPDHPDVGRSLNNRVVQGPGPLRRGRAAA
jgi:Tetratricopeptide repeat